jgi:hypothetical protein
VHPETGHQSFQSRVGANRRSEEQDSGDNWQHPVKSACEKKWLPVEE